jgi:hypothetical protein
MDTPTNDVVKEVSKFGFCGTQTILPKEPKRAQKESLSDLEIWQKMSEEMSWPSFGLFTWCVRPATHRFSWILMERYPRLRQD